MIAFPYQNIILKSYELTRRHIWLWGFGLFLGAGGIMDFFNPGFDATNKQTREEVMALLDGGASELLPAIGLFFGLVLLMVASQALAKAGILWAGRWFVFKEEEPEKHPEELTFGKTLKGAFRYFMPVLGVELLLALAMVLLVSLFAVPILYLFSAGAALRALVLTGLGLVIFLPLLLLFIYIYILAPIFIVVFNRKVKEAVLLAVSLFRAKFKECIVLGLLAAFINAGLILSTILIIILLSLTVSGGQTFLTVLGILPLVINAALAVFFNLTWVLAVKEMVDINRSEKEENYAAEQVA